MTQTWNLLGRAPPERGRRTAVHTDVAVQSDDGGRSKKRWQRFVNHSLGCSKVYVGGHRPAKDDAAGNVPNLSRCIQWRLPETFWGTRTNGNLWIFPVSAGTLQWRKKCNKMKRRDASVTAVHWGSHSAISIHSPHPWSLPVATTFLSLFTHGLRMKIWFYSASEPAIRGQRCNMTRYFPVRLAGASNATTNEHVRQWTPRCCSNHDGCRSAPGGTCVGEHEASRFVGMIATAGAALIHLEQLLLLFGCPGGELSMRACRSCFLRR